MLAIVNIKTGVEQTAATRCEPVPLTSSPASAAPPTDLHPLPLVAQVSLHTHYEVPLVGSAVWLDAHAWLSGMEGLSWMSALYTADVGT
jgi:hypothetical protein